jgi:hypothetical protein
MEKIEDSENSESNVNFFDVIKFSNNTKSEWTDEHEELLREYASKALCFIWLHYKSNAYYSKFYTYFTSIIIIFSTISGIGNFIFQNNPFKQITSRILGTLNIISVVLSLSVQVVKFSQYMEAHKVSFISWDKLYNDIVNELEKSVEDRGNPNLVLCIIKNEFDRILDLSPTITNRVKKKFESVFHFRNPFRIIDEEEEEEDEEDYDDDNKSKHTCVNLNHDEKESIHDLKENWYNQKIETARKEMETIIKTDNLERRRKKSITSRAGTENNI